MAKYKVTRWMQASVPVVSHVEANSSEEAEEESSTAPYNYDYGNSVIGDIEDTDVEVVEEALDLPETGDTTTSDASPETEQVDENYDERVALDFASIDGGLYDDILQAFVDEHGEGYYDDWIITANKEGGFGESIKEDGIDPETGIDSATGKQRIGIKGGYDFDEYEVDADSDGVVVTFGNDEIEIERSDWNEGELTIKVNGESVSENLEENPEDGIERLKNLINFRN